MGNSHDPALVGPLSRALRDSNPAVRAAAATALGRIGSPTALPALRAAGNDTSAAVRAQVERSIRTVTGAPSTDSSAGSIAPRTGGGGGFIGPHISVAPAGGAIPWGMIRYVVLVGSLENRSGYAGDSMAQVFRSEVEQNLRLVRGVAVLNAGSGLDGRTEREIRRRRLPKLRVDGNLARIDRRSQGRELVVRCEVSLMLMDEPDRILRGMLSGAATGSDALRGPRRTEQERRLAEQALAGAVRSAISGVPRALAAVRR